VTAAVEEEISEAVQLGPLLRRHIEFTFHLRKTLHSFEASPNEIVGTTDKSIEAIPLA